MVNSKKEISNPFATGGGGVLFETHVQASFVVLMLATGFVPCFPSYPIKKIVLQGKHLGYDTDDLIVFVENPSDGQEKKLLAQVKHSIAITEGDSVFGEVIQAAWNDFNNPKIFTKGSDSIALITGPLSATDINHVRTILEWARSCGNSEEFFRNVEQTNFSSEQKRGKLKAFQSQLIKSNGGRDIPKEDIFQFLRHFHLLGYDLDIKTGVTLSLLHSLIGQYSQNDARNIWARIIDEVQFTNQNAGSITISSLPHDIQESFKKQIFETIPTNLSKTLAPLDTQDWNRSPYASELAVVNLLGSWSENSDTDKLIVSQLSKEDYEKWIPKIQEILQIPGSPISLKNGAWNINERKELWQTAGQRIFDAHLDIFKQCVINVLSERDPRFELPAEERYAASIHNKVMKHSNLLRKGLAESLALIGSNPQALSNCSTSKPQSIAVLSIRDILKKADWVLWGSLDSLLPLLAEAAPNEFLDAVDAALQQTPCPFDDLFAQERQGIMGTNYLTGLLWGLETLAWDEQCLVRVSVILGELAARDPGGNWANRPSNSLTTIFLPWFPQTTASIEKRKVAIQTIEKENPKVAWKLLLTLLPGQHQMSSGSRKPAWRGMIPEDWRKEVTQKEYWDQVEIYATLSVELAERDITKLEELTGHLDNLPLSSLEKILEYISKKDVTDKPENERMALWTGLMEFVSKHERFADAKWALSSDLVLKIKETANKLAPKNRLNLYRRLFTERDIELFEEKENWQEQQKKLEERRQLAIKEILDNEGTEGVLRFAGAVESPWKVGFSLGFMANSTMDLGVLPTLLESENKKFVQLASGFVCSRYNSRGWVWVDKIDMTGWTHSQIGCFLSYLPFIADTWERTKKILGEFEVAYWSRVWVNPYQEKSDLDVATGKLLEYGRPSAAIRCLYVILNNKQPLNKTYTIKALLSALSPTEPVDSMDGYYIVELIKSLQTDPTTSPDDLAKVEWAYLPLLERDNHGASPKTLENKLASDPKFFCEVIRHVYRSKKEPKSEENHSEQEKNVAMNAYQLLSEWQTPPGTQPGGIFSKERFFEWLGSVEASCKGSGHMEVALTHIGNVLTHCPPDPDGFWLNRGAAEALNAKEVEEMRNGFVMALFNSRGAHWVDPSGKPETELSAKYNKQAEETENAGYHRLAISLRGLADSYANEAKRIIDEHKQEKENDL